MNELWTDILKIGDSNELRYFALRVLYLINRPVWTTKWSYYLQVYQPYNNADLQTKSNNYQAHAIWRGIKSAGGGSYFWGNRSK